MNNIFIFSTKEISKKPVAEIIEIKYITKSTVLIEFRQN